MADRASWWRRLIRSIGNGIHTSNYGYDPDDEVARTMADRNETRREPWEARPTDPNVDLEAGALSPRRVGDGRRRRH